RLARHLDSFPTRRSSDLVAFQHRYSARHPAGRRMEPWTYIVLSAVAGFFVFLCSRENVFKAMTTEEVLTWSQFSKIPLGANGELDRKSTRLNSSHVKSSY